MDKWIAIAIALQYPGTGELPLFPPIFGMLAVTERYVYKTSIVSKPFHTIHNLMIPENYTISVLTTNQTDRPIIITCNFQYHISVSIGLPKTEHVPL